MRKKEMLIVSVNFYSSFLNEFITSSVTCIIAFFQLFFKVKKAPSAGAESAFLIVNELPLINFVLPAADHSSQF